MRSMRKDNRGYSLVELIIVVAIIVIIGGASMWSIGIFFNNSARTCANDIVNAIAECKIKTMSYGEGNMRLIIYKGDDQNVYCELQAKNASGNWDIYDPTKTPEKVGNNKCGVGSTETGGADLQGKDDPMIITFNRSSGSFRYAGDADSVTSVTDIYVHGGTRHYHIHLEKLTGKTTLELL